MKTKTKSWMIAAGVSVLLLAVLRLMPDLWTRTPRNDRFNGLLVAYTQGLVWGSQGLLAAFWAAGRGSLVRRTAVVAVLAAALWFLRVVALKNTGDSFELGLFSVAVAVIDLASFVPTSALVAVFFFLKRGFASPPNFVPPPRQFALSDLFLLTVAAAVLSLIASSPDGRELWRSAGTWDEWGRGQQFLKTLIQLSLVIGLGELVFSLPFARLLFGRRPVTIRLSIASSLTFLGLVLFLAICRVVSESLDSFVGLLAIQLGIWSAYGIAALTMRPLWDEERADATSGPAAVIAPVGESTVPRAVDKEDSHVES